MCVCVCLTHLSGSYTVISHFCGRFLTVSSSLSQKQTLIHIRLSERMHHRVDMNVQHPTRRRISMHKTWPTPTRKRL